MILESNIALADFCRAEISARSRIMASFLSRRDFIVDLASRSSSDWSPPELLASAIFASTSERRSLNSCTSSLRAPILASNSLLLGPNSNCYRSRFIIGLGSMRKIGFAISYASREPGESASKLAMSSGDGASSTVDSSTAHILEYVYT